MMPASHPTSRPELRRNLTNFQKLRPDLTVSLAKGKEAQFLGCPWPSQAPRTQFVLDLLPQMQGRSGRGFSTSPFQSQLLQHPVDIPAPAASQGPIWQFFLTCAILQDSLRGAISLGRDVRVLKKCRNISTSTNPPHTSSTTNTCQGWEPPEAKHTEAWAAGIKARLQCIAHTSWGPRDLRSESDPFRSGRTRALVGPSRPP